MRKTKLNRHNVPVLLRKIAKSQEELCNFAIKDYPQTGFNSDFMTVVNLLELREAIDYYCREEAETPGEDAPKDEKVESI
jgi:hypothetical protein